MRSYNISVILSLTLLALRCEASSCTSAGYSAYWCPANTTDYLCWRESNGFDGNNEAHPFGFIWADFTYDFVYASSDASHPITPSTCPNYMYSATGTGSLLSMSWYPLPSYSQLQTFDFACSTPPGSGTITATPCSLTVTAMCTNMTSSGAVSGSPYSGRFLNMQRALGNGTMASINFAPFTNMAAKSGNGWAFQPQFCSSYSFKATTVLGAPVALHLDNVVVDWWYGRS